METVSTREKKEVIIITSYNTNVAISYHTKESFVKSNMSVSTSSIGVNTPEEKERMFSWGVKSVFTDFL
jgi:hypothetical protein